MATKSGNQYGYTVEAKSGLGVVQLNDAIFTNQWQRVNFPKSPVLGLGVVTTNSPILAEVYLMDYESAQALRWWFKTTDHMHRLLTRLVPHKVSYSIEYNAETPVDEIERWPEIELKLRNKTPNPPTPTPIETEE